MASVSRKIRVILIYILGTCGHIMGQEIPRVLYPKRGNLAQESKNGYMGQLLARVPSAKMTV